MKATASFSILGLLLISSVALADTAPPCMDHGQVLDVNNSQVLNWKATSKNEYHARGHVVGTIENVYADEHGHNHFELQIGNEPSDTVEIIYNIDFGALPQLSIGMTVEACGDYITAFAPSGPYQASPDGALIHWVHLNPSGEGHDSGYLMINGTLYGQNPSGDSRDWND